MLRESILALILILVEKFQIFISYDISYRYFFWTGKKWICSDSERSRLHRQSMGHCRGWLRHSFRYFFHRYSLSNWGCSLFVESFFFPHEYCILSDTFSASIDIIMWVFFWSTPFWCDVHDGIISSGSYFISFYTLLDSFAHIFLRNFTPMFIRDTVP